MNNNTYLCFIASNKNCKNKQCIIDIANEIDIHSDNMIRFHTQYSHCKGKGKYFKVFKMDLNDYKLKENKIFHPNKELYYILEETYSYLSIEENTNELYDKLRILTNKLTKYGNLVADGYNDISYYFDDNIENDSNQIQLIRNDFKKVNEDYNKSNDIYVTINIILFGGIDIHSLEIYFSNMT